MSDVEFFAKVKPQRLTSLGEDFKVEQKQFLEDERLNAIKRAGKQQFKAALTTYERFPEEE